MPRTFLLGVAAGLAAAAVASCGPKLHSSSPVSAPGLAERVRERQAPAARTAPRLSSGAASRERLLARLTRLGQDPGFALGHEDTTAYGVGWVDGLDRSDVKSVCGSHVGVYGWDLFRLERGLSQNGDGVDFDRMREWIAAAHARGGINTISWHSDNPLTLGDAWDRTPAVAAVLPGGTHHVMFRDTFLSKIADYLDSLRDSRGERIPVIFRPYHEHTGDWFWWGSQQTDEAGYVALFRFTVHYLRDERGLENLLFAFSPDGGRISTKQDQLYRYPGDEYVDIVGLDYYFDPGQARFGQLLGWLVEQAALRGKVAALTEFGPRGGVNGPGIEPSFLQQQFLRPILETPGALKIAYALAWRNARPDHAYLPYPGHAAQASLRALCDHEAVLLTEDLAQR